MEGRVGWRALVRGWQADFEASFRAYATLRGFTSVNDRRFAVRAFLMAWAEPGFHRFWQVWNPGISYFPYHLYLRLGGRDRWALATMVAFLANGIAHNALVLPFFRLWWSWTIPVAFFCFGAFTVLSRLLERQMAQARWPTLLNIAVNVALVCLGMDLGFKVDRWL